MPELEYALLQRRVATAAENAGYSLGTTHVEERRTDPHAFEALLASLADLDIRAVIIPTKAHLGRWDSKGSKYEQLRRSTSAEIIVLDPNT